MGRVKLTEQERREHKRESNRRYRDKKIIEREVERLENIKIREIFPTREVFTKEQRQFIFDLLNQPISNTYYTKKTELNNIKMQLGLAWDKIKKNKLDQIEFDLRNQTQEATDYFFEKLPPLVKTLLDKINLDDHWTVFYQYGTNWKQRTIDSITQQFLIDQVEQEIEDRIAELLLTNKLRTGTVIVTYSDGELKLNTENN